MLHSFSLSCAAADSQFEKEAAELGKSCEYCSIMPIPSTTGGGEDFRPDRFATNCGLCHPFHPSSFMSSRYLSCSLYTACPLSSADPQPSSTHGFLTNLRPSESEVSPSTLLFGSSRPPSTMYVFLSRAHWALLTCRLPSLTPLVTEISLRSEASSYHHSHHLIRLSSKFSPRTSSLVSLLYFNANSPA